MQALMVTVMSLLLYSNMSAPLISFQPVLYMTINFFQEYWVMQKLIPFVAF